MQSPRSTGELLRDLTQDASALIRNELELAKAEVADKGRQTAAGAALFAAALLLGLLGAGAFTAFLIVALAIVLPPWAAALIVAVVMLAIAGVLALGGRRQVSKAGPPVPVVAIASMKEDLAWLVNRAKSARTSSEPATGWDAPSTPSSSEPT
jgi:Putative Actinobacterial Holin-X, holin superfamily III